MQHVGCGRKRNHGLRYHLWLIPEDTEVKDVVAYASGDSMQRELRDKREVLREDLDPRYASDEKKDAEQKLSTNSGTRQMTGDRDGNTVMYVWPEYSVDVPIEEDLYTKGRSLSFTFLCTILLDKRDS